MSGSETDIQWYIARDGKQHGPVSDLELKKLVELAHLKPTDLVWRQGFSDWRNAAAVFPAVAEPAPKPAAPAAPTPDARGPSSGPAHGAAFGSPAVATAAPTAVASTTPYAPFTAPAPMPAPGEARKPSFADARPEPAATRPLGAPPRGASPLSQTGQPALAENRKPSEMAPSSGNAPRQKAGGRGRKAIAALGLVALIGVGGWGASRYKDQIFAAIQSHPASGESSTATAAAAVVTAGEAPPANPQPQAGTETAALDASPAASAEEIDRGLQTRNMWMAIKREFPDWYQLRVADVVHMSAERKSQDEITRYLVTQLVALRRENAKLALSAGTERHKELAAAFLANLKHLSKESGESCYDFISKGESSTAIVSRIQNPAESAEIEAQVMAVVAAIVEGRDKPTEHASPVKTDYDVLAGELGRLGWTQADMQLFASPKELAKAPPERVCNMLKDWFTAHLAIQDPGTQERLLFETLKPVVSG